MILNTERYQSFCETVLGVFLHHTTDTVYDHPDEKRKRLCNTSAAYHSIWGNTPNNHFWDDSWAAKNMRTDIQTSESDVGDVKPCKLGDVTPVEGRVKLTAKLLNC